MPNHVDQKLVFRASEAVLDRIEKEVIRTNPTSGERCLDFQQVIPMPPSVSREGVSVTAKAADEARYDRGEDDGYEGWYYWSLRHWATKWNAYDGLVERLAEVLVLRHSTAWSLPVPVLVELARRYPEAELLVSAWEEGGYFLAAGGSAAGSPRLNLWEWEPPLDEQDNLVADWMPRVHRAALDPAGEDDVADLPVQRLSA